MVFRDLKQYGKAISDFTEAIRLQPDLAAAYEYRAVIYDKQGLAGRGPQRIRKLFTEECTN